MPDLLLIGAGRMGGALLQGWQRAGLDYRYSVVEPHSRPEGVIPYADLSALPGDYRPEIVVLAIKPQTWEQVKAGLARFKDALIISIMAGKTLATLCEGTGAKHIVRAMPNLPAMIGHGVTACVATPEVKDTKTATALFDAVGKTVWLKEEKHMDAVTAISGSGPAYLFYFAEALEHAAREIGLPAETARILAHETVRGAARALEGKEPSELRAQVTSPGGTTEAGLRVLMRDPGGLNALLLETAQAAKKRSESL